MYIIYSIYILYIILKIGFAGKFGNWVKLENLTTGGSVMRTACRILFLQAVLL